MGCTTSYNKKILKTYRNGEEITKGNNEKMGIKRSVKPNIYLEKLNSIISNQDMNILKDKMALVFCNSYENSYLNLGDPAINDGILTYESLKKRGYYPILFHDISPNIFVERVKKYISIPNIELVIYFIGHGTRVKDLNGDENDGYDECFVFKGGNIIDDQVGEMIYKCNKTKKLILIADSCHSGTIYDIHKNEPGIITFSACYDNQDAAQYWFDRVGQGAFTYYFWNSIDLNGSDIQNNIKNINENLKCFKQKCMSNHDTGNLF